jgi:hypothetical protein
MISLILFWSLKSSKKSNILKIVWILPKKEHDLYLSSRASLISATASIKMLVMVGAEVGDPMESSRTHRRKSDKMGSWFSWEKYFRSDLKKHVIPFLFKKNLNKTRKEEVGWQLIQVWSTVNYCRVKANFLLSNYLMPYSLLTRTYRCYQFNFQYLHEISVF